MGQKIATIIIIKHQAVKNKEGYAIHHEYPVPYTVGDICETPTGKLLTCGGIERANEDGLLLFKVHFTNGETWHIYPTPPFDIGYFTLKEDGKKDN